MISEYTKQRAIDAADVYDVLSDFLHDLRKKGSSYTCCCPFHSERSASFTVNPARNRWHCFGCGKSGDSVEFLREHENMSFSEAIEYLCRKYSIPIEYEKKERTQEETELHKKKESMLIALSIVQEFFVEQLQADTAEAQQARSYAYGRWGEEYCKEFGVGYAPKSSQPLLDFVKKRALSIPLLIEAGVISTSERGEYAFMRERVTLPIRGDWGKVIAWTGRYIGENDKVGKYMNPSNSIVFEKSESLFGLDSAKRQCVKTGQFIVVEGAPDVMRLQLVGLTEAVAPLGTALTDKHLAKLYRYCKTIRFIPDSDPPKGAVWSPGISAVMKNGKLAMQKGFDVYVREIPRTKEDDTDGVKYDPDSYITDISVYQQLIDTPFPEWLLLKYDIKNCPRDRQREIVNEIAGLIVLIDDKLKRDFCIDSLSRIFGKPKMWREAITEVMREMRESAAEESPAFDKKEMMLLKKHGIIIRNNMYYVPAKDDGIERLSNFILRPLFHLPDSNTRSFIIINEYGYEKKISVPQDKFSSCQAFGTFIEREGCFVWLGKPEKWNKIKEYLYTITPLARTIKQLGYHPESGCFAFADGLHDGKTFHPVDELGMVSLGGCHYKLRAFASENSDKELYEKMLKYSCGNTDTLHSFVQRLITVFGEGAKVAFAWALAVFFRDIIFEVESYFPLLNIFGLRGSGKTNLAMALTSLFYVMKDDPAKLTNTTIASLNLMFPIFSNSILVLDEYTNLLSDSKMELLKGLYGGTGNTKTEQNGDNEREVVKKKVPCGLLFTGQHQPNHDTALFTRCVHLTYFRTVFSNEENDAFRSLMEAAKLGNAHLLMPLLLVRDHFKNSYQAMFKATRSEMVQRLGTLRPDDRLLNNWVCILAVFRILETYIDVPLTYSEMFDVCFRGLCAQNADNIKVSETNDFWSKISSLHTQGKVIDGTHFKIVYTSSFRAEGSTDTINFGRNRALIYLNWNATQSFFEARAGVNQMKFDQSALDSYLKNSEFFLGFKQKRFSILEPNGIKSVVVEDQKRKTPTKNVRAYVFDYESLKAVANIDLETRLQVEGFDEPDEDNVEETPPQTPSPASLFPPSEEEELPF